MLVVLQEVIQWQQSRKFFYWRLRRRLLEAQARKKMEEGGHHLETHAHLDTTLNRWFTEDRGPLNVRLVHLCVGVGWVRGESVAWDTYGRVWGGIFVCHLERWMGH